MVDFKCTGGIKCQNNSNHTAGHIQYKNWQKGLLDKSKKCLTKNNPCITKKINKIPDIWKKNQIKIKL